MGMPHFHNENLAEFRVWCAMAHRQGFMPVYMACANMLMQDELEPLKALGTLIRDAYTRKPMSLGDMD